MASETMLRVNGVDLCVEAFGSPDDPVMLLIAGMSSSMDWWDEGFCEQLADGGRRAVRYDLRDTGRSTTCPPGEPDYTFADLVTDVVGLLDALDVASAHVVGISMGGAIAQQLAVEHPDRLETLTLVDTSFALDDGPDDLPPTEPEVAEFYEALAEQPAPDWSDRAAAVDHLVEHQRVLSRGPIDVDGLRRIAERVVERSLDLRSMDNHGMLEPGPSPNGTLAEITVPTLVIHGKADPLFPLPHGEALARAIPDASLLPLEDVGHEMPPPRTWDVVVPALLRHTSGG